MRPKRKLTTWEKTRKLFNDIHLWAGLISGIIIFVVCLSGTIYTYNTEIREFAAPHLHKVKVESEKKNIDEILNNLKAEFPGKLIAINVSNNPERSYAISMRAEGDNSRGGVTYYVNPYSGALLGTSANKTATDEFMGSLFSLHRWLLLDRIEKPIFESIENRKLGSYITGTATILFTIGVISGMVIWFPRKIRNWKQGLRVKWNGNRKRINHDLHNSFGFYACIFLLIMGLTGPQWSFEWYRTGLRKALGTHQAAAPAAKKAPAQQAPTKNEKPTEDLDKNTEIELLPVESYLQAAKSSVSYPADARLSFPGNSEDPIQVSLNKIGFFAPAAADQVTLNRADAQVLGVDLFKDKPFNVRISNSIKALHIGNVYGQFSKLIYFLACLIATSLPITGTLIWINKMKKPKRKSKRTVKKSKKNIPEKAIY